MKEDSKLALAALTIICFTIIVIIALFTGSL